VPEAEVDYQWHIIFLLELTSTIKFLFFDWRFTGWIELIIVSRIVLRDTNWDGGVPAGISTRDYFGSITD
jgi:hypothetical protein